MSAPALSNPFRGLRPFEPEEAHLFFGRKAQIADLLDRLHRHRFLAVVGSSGCGKSSLARAGVIAALRDGFMAGDGGWRIAVMRPGDSPIAALAAALKAPGALGHAYPGADAGTRLGATLRRGPLGIVDAFRQAALPDDTRLFLLVDQFEELFRFRRDPDRSRAADLAISFVSLLLEASAQHRLDIYVAITMRSEYLGLCDAFADLPEAINDGLYLVPRMTREQVREAIEEPIRLSGADISARLVDRLLNDLSFLEQAPAEGGANGRPGVAGEEGPTRAPDQLPVLQHALTRLWAEWAAEQPRGARIDLAHYERVGRLGASLSNDADQCLAALTRRRQQVAALLFRRLTEVTPDGRKVRREARLGEICGIADSPPAEVVAVVEPFRDEGRSFLMPPRGVELTAESVIDISHESLIRQWERLREWTDGEARSAAIYRRLAHDATRWKEGKGSLWRNPELREAREWCRDQRPTDAWAARYGGDLALALEFLRRSQRRHWLRASVSAWGALAFLALLGLALAFVIFTRVPAGIVYRIHWDGAKLVRPEGLLGVVEARDWVMAQLAWNRREAASDSLRKLIDSGPVEFALSPRADETTVEEDEGRFLLLFRELAESVQDREKRQGLFRLLAPALARADNVEAALDLAARFDDPVERLRLLGRVAVNLPEGSRGRALEIAQRSRDWTRRVEDPASRAKLLADLVPALWPVDERAALVVAREAGRAASALPPAERDRLLTGLAEQFPLVGDIEEAERLATRLPDAFTRDQRLRFVAVAWVVDGRLDRARAVADRVSLENQDQARLEVASALGRRGQPEEALGMAQRIADTPRRDVALQQIATALAQRGQDDVVRRAIGRISQPDARGDAWTSVARTYCGSPSPPKDATTLDDAMRQAGTISSPISRGNLLAALACALLRRGDARAARQAAELIPEPADRVRALLRIARAGGRLGASEVAAEALERAQALLRDAERGAQGLPGLRSDLARAQADRGDLDGALETARAIKDDRQARWQAFAAVAAGEARSGRIGEARAVVVEHITDDTARLQAYARVLIAWKERKRAP